MMSTLESRINAPTYPNNLNDGDAAAAIIRGRIKHHKVGAELLLISSKSANEILNQYNFGNRPPVKSKISEYALALKESRWYITGDTIKFGSDGRLLDGQNRLMACVRTSLPIHAYVVFGVQPDAFVYMDRNGIRTADNVLSIMGYANCSRLSAAARWVKLIDEGRAKQRDVFSPYEILAMVDSEYPGLAEFVTPANKIYAATTHPYSTTMGCLYHFNRADPKLQEEFALAWSGGMKKARFKPVSNMISTLASIKSQTAGRVNEVVRVALAIMAWNAVYEGRATTKKDFDWNTTMDVPKIAGL